MKYSVFAILISFGFFSYSQETANYEFSVESKYNTEVVLAVEVYYHKKAVYNSNDLMIKKINSTVRDSLERFDIFEMYTSQRRTMQTIIDKVYKAMLQEVDVIIDSVNLVSVVIPFEAQQLNDKLLRFKKDYSKIDTEIKDRISSLKEKIKLNSSMSDADQNKIEIEIKTLENYKYISKLYENKLKGLIE